MKIIELLKKASLVTAALLLVAFSGCNKAEQSETVPADAPEAAPAPKDEPEAETPKIAEPEAQTPQIVEPEAEAPKIAEPESQNEPIPPETTNTPSAPTANVEDKISNNDRELHAIKAAANNGFNSDLTYGVSIPHPKIRLDKPEVIGSIDQRIIQKIARQHLNEISICYEKEYDMTPKREAPKLAGKVTLRWLIAPKGDVSKVEVTETTLNNKKIENCLISSIKYWRFPAPKGGGIVQVTYPIEFEPPQSR